MRHNTFKDKAQAKRQPVGYRFASDNYEHFQVIYISRGELEYSDETQDRTMGPGGLLILRKTSSFVLSSPGVGYRGVCFNAYRNLAPAMIGSSEVLWATPEIRMLGGLMEQYITNPVSDDHDLVTGLGRVMGWEAIKLTQTARKGIADRTGRGWGVAARAVLDATLYTNTGPREILEELPMSYRQLSRYFSQTFGQSPKQYQLVAKLTEARKMLAETTLSITTIAMELGFASSQHFATQFKIFANQSPSEYRAESTGTF